MTIGCCFWILCFLISVWVCTGWLVADFQGDREYSSEKLYRGDLGVAVLLALTASYIVPLGTFVIYLLTGFAQHGWYIRPRKDDE